MAAITLELELGEKSLNIIQALADALGKFQNMPERQSASYNGEEFLSSAEFCRKYHIGRSTLMRRVQEQKVIKSDCGGRTPRYRWAKGYGGEI